MDPEHDDIQDHPLQKNKIKLTSNENKFEIHNNWYQITV